MAFELLTWVLEAGLTASAKKAATTLRSKTLDAGLGSALMAWASQLPEEAAVHAMALFPRQIDHEEMAARPSLSDLQRQLREQRIPTLVQWHQVLIEQWTRVREQVGPHAQPFFLLDEETVRPHLFELARELVRVCEREDSLFHTTVIEHLEAMREESTLLPLPLQQGRLPDVQGLATRISELGVGVFLIVHDAASRTLSLWLHVPATSVAELKFSWASVAAIASGTPDTDFIELGTCRPDELRETDARGPIGTMRVRVKCTDARELASARKLTPAFWERVTVSIIDQYADNTAYQRWIPIPFSNLEVPLGTPR